MDTAVLPPAGAHCHNKRALLEYPLDQLEEIGCTGTVVESRPDLLLIKMDIPILGLEKYGNTVQRSGEYSIA